jgi:hypothetical protein
MRGCVRSGARKSYLFRVECSTNKLRHLQTCNLQTCNLLTRQLPTANNQQLITTRSE